MGGESVLIYEKRDHVTLLTLNRPRVHNAMNPEMACRLDEAIQAFIADDEALVLVVTGAGEKSFCAGGDLARTLPLLTGARQPEDEFDHRIVKDPDILTRAVFRLPDLDKPVIAAINGHCLAGGTEMALNTDIRIAAEHATFGLPEVRHGLIPFAGALARMPQQIPYCHAMEILLVGAPLSARTAAQLGLINHVLPSDEVLPKALDLAEKIARNGPLAVRTIKATIAATVGKSLSAAFACEDEARSRIMASADAREGPAAFIEKRRPQFTGR